MIKQMHPEAEVTGLDEDSNILEIARKKAAKAGVEITLLMSKPITGRFSAHYLSIAVGNLMKEDSSENSSFCYP